jgi:restriction system protein
MPNRSTQEPPWPSRARLMWFTLRALRELGGTASVTEINNAVAKLSSITQEQRKRLRSSGDRRDFDYRCAWARTHMKGKGAIEKTSARNWQLTTLGSTLREEDL